MSLPNTDLYKAGGDPAVADQFVRSTSLRRYRLPLIVICLIFLAAVAASFVLMVYPSRDVFAALAVPFSLVQATLFMFLGVAITAATGPDRDEREHELRERAETGERRAKEAEEEAMKGRALAAALQADARTERSRDSDRHARLSRSLFGDLIGDDPYLTTPGPLPQVSGISRDSGPAAGGTPLVIAGSGFTGATGVVFGSNAAVDISVDSDVQITAKTPPGAGSVDVFVTTPAGTSAPNVAARFTYLTASGSLP